LVPLLDVNAQNLPLEAELKAAFERVLKSGQFIMGPDVDALESEIARMIDGKHAIGLSSGTDAILLALMALEIKAGDEVLCPSYTFFATAGCIARVGAIPIFVDADPITFTINIADARRKVTARSKAIIPVHLFGQSCDMDAVMEFARAHGLMVIEDAAQALGARYKGRSAGTMGTLGTYSFFPSKNLGALGDGGMIVSNDDALAERARLLRNHGAKPKYYHKHIGGNFRLDSLQAAFLRVKLPHFSAYTNRRKANAAFYTERLSKLPSVVLAGDYQQNDRGARLVLPAEMPGCDHIWNQYTLRIPGQGRRDALRTRLTEAGIGTEIYYPIPLHRQECFAYCASQNGEDSCPIATELASQSLSIPIYPELTTTQLNTVTDGIRNALK